MTRPRLLEDILNQPLSLARVLDFHLGEGRPALLEGARMLRDARRIVITGMGGSLFAAMPLRYFLTSRGFACELVDTSELLHYLKGGCGGTVVIMVSRSGETIEIVKLLGALGLAVRTIGVTNEPESTLARGSHCPILVDSLRDGLVAVQTYTGTTLALLLLGAAAAEDPETEWAAASHMAIRALAEVLERYETESLSWREFLLPAPAVYLLARGPSMASAHAGSLLFHEVAKTPAVAMTAGGFRHGPVEAADPDFRGLVFAPEGPTRGLNLNLARDLVSFGAQVRVIGPDAGALSWDTGSVPELLSQIVEIAPVQFAALRLAEWKGIPPGRFRYVSHVTLAESGFAVPAR